MIDVRTRARQWFEEDPDPSTKAELEALLAAEGESDLADRFAGMLQFGTAGLRGVLGAGPNRMNRLVVAKTTAGLCEHLLATTTDAKERGVVIGYDGRRMSFEFAQEAAEIIAASGIRALLFDSVVATPVLAFSVLDRGAAAGVMVTASHNPPEYNGYKVYWGNGAQIIPPHDEGIAAAIARVGPYASIPRLPLAEAASHGLCSVLGDELVDRYVASASALQLHAEVPRDLSIAYTALHGVGARFVRDVFARAGFQNLRSVQEQDAPDGAFPTVRFPNPEEKGAMDRVLALAERVGAELVIANDPDADRLALAVRSEGGGYEQLTGNDVGSLLAHYVLSEGEADERVVLSSIVSSPMIGAIAAAHDAHWETTLTGFKWIANRAIELAVQDGYEFVFGYEEALGYTVGTLVRDKDGISAALVAADMAQWCKARGGTLLSELESMWRKYGMFLSKQISETSPGTEGALRIAAIMRGVRSNPPLAFGTYKVASILDLEQGTRTFADSALERVHLPSSNVIAFDLEGGHRLMLRPSGTEPKIKYYLDVRVDLAPGESIASARARGAALLEDLGKALLAEVSRHLG